MTHGFGRPPRGLPGTASDYSVDGARTADRALFRRGACLLEGRDPVEKNRHRSGKIGGAGDGTTAFSAFGELSRRKTTRDALADSARHPWPSGEWDRPRGGPKNFLTVRRAMIRSSCSAIMPMDHKRPVDIAPGDRRGLNRRFDSGVSGHQLRSLPPYGGPGPPPHHEGQAIGIITNNGPSTPAALDPDWSNKATHFISGLLPSFTHACSISATPPATCRARPTERSRPRSSKARKK